MAKPRRAIESTTLTRPIGPPAVAPSQRNGHAVVLWRMLDHLRAVRSRGGPPAITLTRIYEEDLRDADELQLDGVGLALARCGRRDEWRAYLRDVFRIRYGVTLSFVDEEPTLRLAPRR